MNVQEALKIIIELGHGIELKLGEEPSHYMTKIKNGRYSQPKLVYIYDSYTETDEFETVDELIRFGIKKGRIPDDKSIHSD